MIAAANLSAISVFMRSRFIDYKMALVLEPITCIGALLGGLTSVYFSEQSLILLFGFILMMVSALMYYNPQQRVQGTLNRPTGWYWHRTFNGTPYGINLTIGLPLVLLTGYLGGLLGVAGGFIKVPMMVLLFGVPIKVAIATSSLMVAITSSVGCMGHVFEGHFDSVLAIALALAAVAGAQIGSRLTVRADKSLLKRLFAVVLLIVAVWMIGRGI